MGHSYLQIPEIVTYSTRGLKKELSQQLFFRVCTGFAYLHWNPVMPMR